MWKVLLTLTMLVSVCTMAGCDVQEMSTLSDLSRPYVGVYACERLLIGGSDCIGDFDFIRLELEYGGTYTLSYRAKTGRSEEIFGTYVMDTTRDEVTMSVKQGAESFSRTFRMEDGAIVVEENFMGTSLFARFR